MVARREIVERGRSRSYRISTVFTVLVVLAVTILPQVMATSTESTIETVDYASVEQGEEALEQGDIDALLVGADDLVVPGMAPTDPVGLGADSLVRLVNGAALALRVEELATGTGRDPAEITALLAGDAIDIRGLEPSDPNRESNEGIAFFGLFLLYLAIIVYGTWNLTGVTEEKTNRVVEILLSTLRPHHILAGKVLGIGVLGLIQFAAIIAAGSVAIFSFGVFELPTRAGTAVAATLVWFVLGYAFYSVVNASLGALVSRMEDTNAIATPISMVAVASFLVALSALERPDGALAVVASFVPSAGPLLDADSDGAGSSGAVGGGRFDPAHGRGDLRAGAAGRADLRRGDPPGRGTGQAAGGMAVDRAGGVRQELTPRSAAPRCWSTPGPACPS